MAYSFDTSQVAIAQTIIRVGQSLGATPFQIRAALAAGYVESRWRNLSRAVDRDSLGVFQQRPSQGWGTPAQVLNVEYAARKFYEAAFKVSGAATEGQLAQRVQRSAYPSRYDEQIGAVDEILRRLGSGSQSAGSTSNGNDISSYVPAPFQNASLDGIVIAAAVGIFFLILLKRR